MDRLDWRAKIGLIVVSSSTVSETRYPRVAPRDIGFFTSRMLIPPGESLAALVEMEKNATRAAEELASAKVDSIAYCCTVSGALRGKEKDQEFCREMEASSGTPTTSTMLAVTEALQHLGLRQIVVTSPYPDSHHDAERAYMEECGIHPLLMRGMGFHSAEEFAAVSPEEIFRFSMEAWRDVNASGETPDGLFVSCMNLDAMAAAQALEDEIGKPVVTSHSATLWRALSLAGIQDSIPGYGRLLEEPRPAGISQPA